MNPIFRVLKSLSPPETFGLFLLALGIVSFGWYFINEQRVAEQYSKTATEWSLIGRPVTAKDHTIGSVSAPIQVIVYSSIACKYCRTFFERDVPRLQAAFGDKIVIAYRHNPVPAVPNAQIQEPASECVYQLGGNDAFWRFVYLLFPQAQRADATGLNFLGNIAVQAGVSAKDFATCMGEDGGTVRVRQDSQEAAVGGLNIDPSFLLKSAHRALVVKGNYYSQVYTGIQYLLDAEAQMSQGVLR